VGLGLRGFAKLGKLRSNERSGVFFGLFDFWEPNPGDDFDRFRTRGLVSPTKELEELEVGEGEADKEQEKAEVECLRSDGSRK
jgi:hypothetical protein